MSDQTSASEPVQPGACRDASCPVLHADPRNPIHPPDYEPAGPMLPDLDQSAPYPTEQTR